MNYKKRKKTKLGRPTCKWSSEEWEQRKRKDGKQRWNNTRHLRIVGHGCVEWKILLKTWCHAVKEWRETHRPHIKAMANGGNKVHKNDEYKWLAWLSGLSVGCELKGHGFDSQSGHMPGLRARSPAGGVWEATYCCIWCFSPSLPPSLPLSKNKSVKSLKNTHK